MPGAGYGTPTSVSDPVAKAQAESDREDAIGGFKGGVINLGKGLSDMFSGEEVTAYNANPDNFNLGGQAGYANERAGALGYGGQQVAGDLRVSGQQGMRASGTTAAGINAQGLDTAASQGRLADNYASQGQGGNAMQQARSLGFSQQGSQGASQGVMRADTQAGQAKNITDQAFNASNQYGDRSALAMGRNDVGVTNGYNQAQDRQLETQGRAQQLAAAQSLGMRANDGAGQANTQGLRNFAGQTGQGPSAAQAQMQAGSDNSMASALALARSGRAGNNTGAMRQASFQNAATQQQTNQQLGTLRAQEYDQAQNRQLNALNAESQAQLGYRGQDLNALQGAAGVLGQARGQDQSQQQIGAQQGQFDASLGMQNRQLNDQTALAWSQQQQQAAARGDNAFFQGQQLGNQSIAQGQQMQLGMGGLANQASAQGQQYDLGKGQLANQALGQGQQFQLGAMGAAQAATNQGQNYNAQMQGLGNQYSLGMQGLAGQTLGQQLQADMGYEQLQSQQYLEAQKANQANDAQRDSANTGMISGLVGGLMMSDERSKKEITSLKGKLGEAYAALGGGPPKGAQFDRDALDDAYRGQGGTLPSGSSYSYKQPGAFGAAAGQHVGPMAQDLERNPATRGTVVTGPDGMKRVDTGRLALVNTAALSDTQRDVQEMKHILSANNDDAYDQSALDAAYEREGGRVTKPKRSWRDEDPLDDRYANSDWRQQPGF